MTSRHPITRRALLRGLLILPGGALIAGLRPTTYHAAMPQATADHPEPREGITSALVLSEGDLPEKAHAAYRAAREYPEVLDGLYCHCDCGRRDGMRSLLSCFETRMPVSCSYCREEAELAGRLRRDGWTLDKIRAAVDVEFA